MITSEIGLQTIILKMADQGRSDLDIAFTMILCDTNFYLVRYETHIHKLASKKFLRARTHNIKAGGPWAV